tara:strand:- start:175 stop:591 length:417 start_codon:yes stop_codon:yes gene_type:complete
MYEYKAVILRVVDGDTVDVDIDLGFDVCLKKQRIRLYGVDTPESRTRDLEEKMYGNAAKDFVQSFLPVGTNQTLVTKLDDRGKFGRILGEFKVYNSKLDGQTTINQMLIDEHHAVAYHGQSKDDIEAEHLENRKKVQL